MKTPLTVPKNYQTQECLINFENYKFKTANLDDFIHELKVIETLRKQSTWGRCYIEVPPKVLNEFGIISTLPLVTYVNYVFNKKYFYCYSGEIFSGDAAWFDYYNEVQIDSTIETSSYKHLKNALEIKEKSFLDHFDYIDEKWREVPVENEYLAEFARNLNTHIK